MTEKEKRSDAEWRQRLTPTQFHVMREAGTEPPWSGEYVHSKEKGTYRCSGCGAALFASEAKFDSGSGWPSFTEAVDAARVTLHEDRSHGMRRVEVRCAQCEAHLGHVFDDGPRPTGRRFCINSVCLRLEEEKQKNE